MPSVFWKPDSDDDLDLEPVEDPGHPEPEDDRPVELRPREPVHARGHQTPDGAVSALCDSFAHANSFDPNRCEPSGQGVLRGSRPCASRPHRRNSYPLGHDAQHIGSNPTSSGSAGYVATAHAANGAAREKPRRPAMPAKKRSTTTSGTDLPSTLERSSRKAQETWLATHDSAVEEYGEGERAHRTAFASLKHSFEKVGDHWEEKDHKGPAATPQGGGRERVEDPPARPRGTVGRARALADDQERARRGDPEGERPGDRCSAEERRLAGPAS